MNLGGGGVGGGRDRGGGGGGGGDDGCCGGDGGGLLFTGEEYSGSGRDSGGGVEGGCGGESCSSQGFPQGHDPHLISTSNGLEANDNWSNLLDEYALIVMKKKRTIVNI